MHNKWMKVEKLESIMKFIKLSLQFAFYIEIIVNICYNLIDFVIPWPCLKGRESIWTP